MKKKNIGKRLIILSFIAIVFATVVVLFFVRNSSNSTKEMAFKMQVEQGYIHLTDDYDANGLSLGNFLSNNKSEKILKTTLDYLRKEKDYFFLDAQDVYVDNFNELLFGNIFFVADNDRSLIYGDTAPIKSLQGDSSFFKCCNLKNYRNKQIDFNAINFKPINVKNDKPISVVLGYNYKDYLKIGERFKGRIYEGLDLEFIVKDFLKEKTYVHSKQYNSGITEFVSEKTLDNYIIVPNFYLKDDNSNNERNYMINLLQRCEGIYFVNSKKDCKQKINVIKHIKERTGFQLSTHFALD